MLTTMLLQTLTMTTTTTTLLLMWVVTTATTSMPTTFTTSFIDNNNEFVHADHVKQFASPVNNLENGAAHYSPDTGTEDIYRLNFASGNAIEGSAPTIGRRINFKAKAANSGASVVIITGASGELLPIPLTKRGGEPLESGDIAQHQAISAIYVEDQGVGRFEVLGARPDTNSPAGSLLYTYDPAPSGYLEANGQVVDQAAYPELFSQIGLLENALSSASLLAPHPASLQQAASNAPPSPAFTKAPHPATAADREDVFRRRQ